MLKVEIWLDEQTEEAMLGGSPTGGNGQSYYIFSHLRLIGPLDE